MLYDCVFITVNSTAKRTMISVQKTELIWSYYAIGMKRFVPFDAGILEVTYPASALNFKTQNLSVMPHNIIR